MSEVVNGRDAFANDLHGPPLAILLDLDMPVTDAFAFLHELRDKTGRADNPLILIGARNISSCDRKRLRYAGAESERDDQSK